MAEVDTAAVKRRPFIRYLRDEKRHPIALAVFFKSNRDDIKFGWSKWNPHDPFSKAEGLKVALRRSRPVGEMAAELYGIEDDVNIARANGRPEPALACIPAFVRETYVMAKRYFEGTPRVGKKAVQGHSVRGATSQAERWRILAAQYVKRHGPRSSSELCNALGIEALGNATHTTRLRNALRGGVGSATLVFKDGQWHLAEK